MATPAQRSLDLVNDYAQYLARVRSLVTGNPKQLRQAAAELGQSSQAATWAVDGAEAMLTKSKEWKGPTAVAFRFRLRQAQEVTAAVEREIAATQQPLLELAEKQESAHYAVGTIAQDFDREIVNIYAFIELAFKRFPVRDREHARQAYIMDAGEDASKRARAVLNDYHAFATEKARELRDTDELTLSRLQQAFILTPYGEHQRDNPAAAISRDDWLFALAHAGTGTIRETARKIHFMPFNKALGYGGSTIFGATLRNGLMMGASQSTFVDPRTQGGYSLFTNFLGTYGSNAASMRIGELASRGKFRPGTDAVFQLALNNTLTSLVLQETAPYGREGYAVTDKGILIPVTNRTYYEEAFRKWGSLVGVSVLTNFLDTGYRGWQNNLDRAGDTLTGAVASSTNPQLLAMNFGRLSEQADVLSESLHPLNPRNTKAGLTTAATSLVLTTGTMMLNAQHHLPPEPGPLRMVTREVGYASQYANDNFIQPIVNSDYVQVIAGVTRETLGAPLELASGAGGLVGSAYDISLSNTLGPLWPGGPGSSDIASQESSSGALQISGAREYSGSMLTQGISPAQQEDLKEHWARFWRAAEKIARQTGDVMKNASFYVP